MKKELQRLVIAFAIFSGLFFFAYRSCTTGYDRYAVYVEASEQSIFGKPLNPADPRIVSHGRKLRSEVMQMDQDLDDGDGAQSGRVRWYVCSGIDCEEGWESQF